MIPAPMPADEADRLQSLRQLLILDTPPEERFDKIVEFAAAEFDVPIALLSFVDENRQWFKARVGLEVCETSRDISFCGHAVASGELLMVEDALLDERFADNPLVVGEPHVRFYAGAPLQLSDGTVAGTLCLIDTHPRRIDRIDVAILETLRDLILAEIQGQGAAE